MILSLSSSSLTPKELEFPSSPSNSKNKLKQEAITYSFKHPKSPSNYNFNKPLVTADRVKFNYDHYHYNSPNFYKKSYYTSTFCRNYKKPKILQGIFNENSSKSLMNLDEVPEKISFKSLYNLTLFSPSKSGKNSLNKLNSFKSDKNSQSIFYQSTFLKGQNSLLDKKHSNNSKVSFNIITFQVNLDKIILQSTRHKASLSKYA